MFSMNKRIRDSKLFYQMIYFSCSTAEGPFWGLGDKERLSEKRVKPLPVAQWVGVSSCTPKSHRFDSWSRHV